MKKRNVSHFCRRDNSVNFLIWAGASTPFESKTCSLFTICQILPVLKNLPNLKNLSFLKNLLFHKILQFSKKSKIKIQLLSILIFLNIIIVKLLHHFLISMSHRRQFDIYIIDIIKLTNGTKCLPYWTLEEVEKVPL